MLWEWEYAHTFLLDISLKVPAYAKKAKCYKNMDY